jgi:hypothetical protein
MGRRVDVADVLEVCGPFVIQRSVTVRGRTVAAPCEYHLPNVTTYVGVLLGAWQHPHLSCCNA